MIETLKQHTVLFAASEVYPFAKSGGLADVAFSLPRALSKHFDIAVVMPLYRSVDTAAFDIRLIESFAVAFGGRDYPVELYGCTYEGISYYFLYSPLLSECEHLYGPPESGYEDNDLRFGIFCYGIMEVAARCGCGVLHLNDWQTALCALLAKEIPHSALRTIFTIHNLAYQGVFEAKSLERLGLASRHFDMETLEFYGKLNFMKAGIGFSDALSTVSGVYAQEICTERFGCGLDGYLRHHKAKLSGILNGIDTLHFDPRNDPALTVCYDNETYVQKQKNKAALFETAGFAHPERPFFVLISRLTWQKGIDLFIEALEGLLAMELNIAVLGEGEMRYIEPLQEMAQRHENFHLRVGYDEGLSHRMYAASDFLLMPSLFEPCGLNQMIAMRYGSIPVVHAIGGLKESVQPQRDYRGDASVAGYGITFDNADANALLEAVDEALRLYEDHERYETICRHNMRRDFSWGSSAEAYAALYDTLLES